MMPNTGNQIPIAAAAACAGDANDTSYLLRGGNSEQGRTNLTDMHQADTPDKSTGLTGAAKVVSNLGIVGAIAALLIVLVIGGMWFIFGEIRANREDYRNDRKAGIEHGDKAVEKITNAIDKQTLTIEQSHERVIHAIRENKR